MMKVFLCVIFLLGGVTIFKLVVFREEGLGTSGFDTLPTKKSPDHSHTRAKAEAIKAEKTSVVVSKVVSSSDELFEKVETLIGNGDLFEAVQVARNLTDPRHAAQLFELGDNKSFPQGVRINLLTEAMRLFGSGGDAETAITVYLSSIGEGIIKKSLVLTLFRESDFGVDEFVELTTYLDSPDSVRLAFEGIGQSLAKKEHLDFAEMRKLVDTEPFGKEAASELLSNFAFSMGVRDYGDISVRFDESLSILKSLELSESESGELLGKIIKRSNKLDPFATWDKLKPDAYSDILSADNLQVILKGMSSRDPFRTLEIVSADSSNRFSEKDRMDVALRAISMDEKLARDSYQTFIERKGADASFFSAAFAMQAIEGGDFEEAIKFVQNTEDGGLRKHVGSQLRKKQQKSIIKEIAAEPEKTVSGFIDGTTRYEEYMLETALSRWIAKEPEQAANWTEENISTMADGPRQYVAASYAREAAAQGDVTVARHWANIIQDEKTLNRINAIIKQVEQTNSN